MAVVANVAVNLDARQAKVNSDELTRKVGRLNTTLKDTEKKAATATANVQRFGIAFRSVLGPIVGVIGAVNLLSRSLKVLGERQADAAGLANGLAKIGGTRADLVRLQQIADKLGKQTLFNQEDFDRGFTLLTSFQSIGVRSYERVAKAAADVAQVTRQDVNSSLLQLAKALQDPVKGLAALARSGTQFTEAQQELIKGLVASGKLLEAQDFILKEIEKQYGNAATAAGSAGYAGAVDSLQESFRDFQERLAKGVEPAVSGTLKALTDLFELANKIPEPVGRTALAIGGMTAAIVALRAAAIATLPKLKALFAFVIANPWIALAAGITAATIALAGFRTETQRLAGVAAGGDPAGIAAARGRLTQTEQRISELTSIRSRTRAQSSELRRLRQQQAQLRTGITTGTAALTGAGAGVGAGDGDAALAGAGAGAGKASSEAKKLADELQRSLERGDQLFKQFSRQAALLGDISDTERKRLQIQYDYQDRAEDIAELQNAEQRANLTDLNNEIKRLQLLELQTEELKKQLQLFYERAGFGRIPELLPGGAGAFMLGITLDPANEAQNKINQFKKELEALQDPINMAQRGAEGIGDAFLASFRGLITGAQTAQEALASFFQNVANAFIDMATEIIQRMIVMYVFKQLLGLFGGGGGGIFGAAGAPNYSGVFGAGSGGLPGFSMGSSLLTPRAAGGPVSKGGSYLVGEQGPELFVPSSSGSIVPNQQLGGNTNVVVNVDAKGTSVQGSDQEGNQLGRVIAAAIQQELIKQQRPGGLLTR